MSNAFATDVRRSIKGSLGRFIAIAAIVALGTGFYAGLLMTPIDMNEAADRYFDDTGLMDIRVVSTLGITEQDVSAIAAVEGVEAVMPAYQTDAMVVMAGEQYATRIHSLPPAAASSDTSDGRRSLTSHPAYLNRPILVEGAWPTAEGECVISADIVAAQNVSLGDVVHVEAGSAAEADGDDEAAGNTSADESADETTDEAGAGTEASSTNEAATDTADEAAASTDEAAAQDDAAAADKDAEAEEDDLDAEVTTPTFSYDDEADDMLATQDYVVVGFVSAPAYAVSSPMGSTSIGSGTIQQFMYVPETDFEGEDLPYSEVFVTVAGAQELNASSAAYEQRVAQVTEGIKAIAGERATLRVESLRGDAQAELDDARAEYDRQKAEADSKLADAKTELDDAEDKIAENEQKIKDGEEEYEKGVEELDKKKEEADKQFEDAEKEFEDAEKQLEDASKSLTEASDKLDAEVTKYNDAATQLNEAWQVWQKAAKEVSENISEVRPVVEEAQANLDDAKKQIEHYKGELNKNLSPKDREDAQNKIEEYENVVISSTSIIDELGPKLVNLQDAEGEVDKQRQDLDAQQEKVVTWKAELDEQQAAFDSAKAEYEANRKDLDQGKLDLETQKTKAQEEIDAAQKKLDDAKAELDSGKEELEQAKTDLREGRSEYERRRVEVNKKLTEAERELANAQNRIDELEEASWYVLDRDSNYGAASYQADADRIAAIASVFPLIFFLVAALVALTTMTRMVDEERQFIGTLKAIGFNRRRIASKYLVYAALASGIGAVIGIVVLSEALPYVIMSSYAIMYYIPVTFPLPLNVPIVILAAGLGIGITLLATASAAWAVLRERPAALMLPPAPKAGKRILLERTPLWKHFSFTWKVTLRNLFRYKRRFIMTVVGIAGCTALLLTGFGLADSIGDILNKQFGEITKFNATVTFSEDAIDADYQEAALVLKDADLASGNTPVMLDQMKVTGPDASNKTIELVVPADPGGIDEFFTMRTRTGHQAVELPSNGFVLTEKIAGVLGVGPGDVVTLVELDDAGNATDVTHSVQVTGVIENYLYNYGFMGPTLFTEVMGEAPVFDALYVKATDVMDNREVLTERLRDIPGVSTVLYNDETIDTYRTMLNTVNKVVVVLIVAAALLAFIVLYNLSNINITERVREIATLKVLGFTPGETMAYIFREIILLAIIGALFGLVLGVGMESFVVVTAEVDQTMFGRDIHVLSFVLSFVLTLVFTGLVLLAMRGKIARVNMVESLKSNE